MLPVPPRPEGAVPVPVPAARERIFPSRRQRSHPGAPEEPVSGQKAHVLYNFESLARPPIVVNPLPTSFSFSPRDQQQMTKWNYYADIFRVMNPPSDEYGWKNGVFDLAGWPDSDEVEKNYGSPWDDGVLATTFLRYDADGNIIEADICMNPDFDWTSDDEWVYEGGPVVSFRRTMTHEMGHMWGAEHNFDTLSLMNYPPNPFRGFSLPFEDDAEAVRAAFPDRMQRHQDLGVYLFYREGGGADDQEWRDAFYRSVVKAGTSFYVTDYRVENVGTETINAPTIDWYLTKEHRFAPPYYYLGTEVYPSLERFESFTTDSVGFYLTVPAGVPPGDYYLAAYIRNDEGAAQESFAFSNNYAFGRHTTTVTAP
jgi:hypothetical protein